METLKWDNPKDARHSCRVIMDKFNLRWAEKDLLCAVIMQESGFKNSATNKNRNKDGVVTSTDYGICQINSRYHIGEGKTFPSVEYVLENPDKVVEWMIKTYQAGHLFWWCAYANKSYLKWL